MKMQDEGRPSLGPIVLEQRHAEGLSSLESDGHYPRVTFFTSKHRICHVAWIDGLMVLGDLPSHVSRFFKIFSASSAGLQLL